MSDMLSDHETNIKCGYKDSYGRENKKEVILIVDNDVGSEQGFDQVYPVLDHNRAQSGQHTDDHTQDHDEVLLTHIFNAPDQESPPYSCSFHEDNLVVANIDKIAIWVVGNGLGRLALIAYLEKDGAVV